jgi:MYXO-CTERM domain-containing protein
MAMAQDAYGYAYGYASARFYNVAGSGMYVTGSGGQYYSYSAYTYGDAGGGDSLGYNVGNPAITEVYGESYAYTAVGGSYDSRVLDSYNWVTITNTSNYYQYEFVDAYTASSSEGFASNYNAYGYGESYGWVYDSAGALDQYSETGSFALGLGYGGTYGYAYNYDYYNGLTGVYAYFGGSFPNGVSAGISDTQAYTLIFAPGASDTFYVIGDEAHVAYATTPAPAAIAPFALGLLGGLRRRRKA